MQFLTSSYLKSPFFNEKKKFGKFHRRHQCTNFSFIYVISVSKNVVCASQWPSETHLLPLITIIVATFNPLCALKQVKKAIRRRKVWPFNWRVHARGSTRVYNDVIMNLGVWETSKSKNAITEPKSYSMLESLTAILEIVTAYSRICYVSANTEALTRHAGYNFFRVFPGVTIPLRSICLSLQCPLD